MKDAALNQDSKVPFPQFSNNLLIANGKFFYTLTIMISVFMCY